MSAAEAEEFTAALGQVLGGGWRLIHHAQRQGIPQALGLTTDSWVRDRLGPWAGRLWMNPPYSQPAVDRFCTRLAREYRAGNVTEAIALVNNATETVWFQEMAAQCSAFCFPRGRVRFWRPRQTSAPLQGQALLYLGPNSPAFRAAFVRFGFVTERTECAA